MSRELPIIFDGESVSAILAGRKTQMRKVIDPQPPKGQGCNLLVCRTINHEGPDRLSFFWGVNQEGSRQPAYQPGDVLWVKESWRPWSEDDCGCVSDYNECFCDKGVLYAADCMCDSDMGPWKSPVSMPKKSARLWLRVTDVRAERLQDIDAAGIIGEGVFQEIADDPGYDNLSVAQGVFWAVWDRLNAKKGHSWESNPWVWVYGFKVERMDR